MAMHWCGNSTPCIATSEHKAILFSALIWYLGWGKVWFCCFAEKLNCCPRDITKHRCRGWVFMMLSYKFCIRNTSHYWSITRRTRTRFDAWHYLVRVLFFMIGISKTTHQMTHILLYKYFEAPIDRWGWEQFTNLVEINSFYQTVDV